MSSLHSFRHMLLHIKSSLTLSININESLVTFELRQSESVEKQLTIEERRFSYFSDFLFSEICLWSSSHCFWNLSPLRLMFGFWCSVKLLGRSFEVCGGGCGKTVLKNGVVFYHGTHTAAYWCLFMPFLDKKKSRSEGQCSVACCVEKENIRSSVFYVS